MVILATVKMPAAILNTVKMAIVKISIAKIPIVNMSIVKMDIIKKSLVKICIVKIPSISSIVHFHRGRQTFPEPDSSTLKMNRSECESVSHSASVFNKAVALCYMSDLSYTLITIL